MLVQGVDVRALQPVPRHHQRVHKEVPVAEGDEGLGHRDALFRAHFLHLQHRAADGDEPELHPVIRLRSGGHGRIRDESNDQRSAGWSVAS